MRTADAFAPGGLVPTRPSRIEQAEAERHCAQHGHPWIMRVHQPPGASTLKVDPQWCAICGKAVDRGGLMDLPGLIRVVRQGNASYVEVDGKAFPYPVEEGGATIQVSSRGDAPSVQLTLIARRVEVHDSLDDKPSR